MLTATNIDVFLSLKPRIFRCLVIDPYEYRIMLGTATERLIDLIMVGKKHFLKRILVKRLKNYFSN